MRRIHDLFKYHIGSAVTKIKSMTSRKVEIARESLLMCKTMLAIGNIRKALLPAGDSNRKDDIVSNVNAAIDKLSEIVGKRNLIFDGITLDFIFIHEMIFIIFSRS